VEAVMLFSWHRNQEETAVYFLVSWHTFLGLHTVLSETEIQASVLAQISRETVQLKGTEFEELTCAFEQEILAQILRSIWLRF
jgi:hypothetical protein